MGNEMGKNKEDGDSMKEDVRERPKEGQIREKEECGSVEDKMREEEGQKQAAVQKTQEFGNRNS
jgi:hypothetical protein